MLDWLNSLFDTFASALMSVLPQSPFSGYIASFGDLPYLSWLNWFVPIGECITLLEAWLIAIALFYVYSIVLRWLKALGD